MFEPGAPMIDDIGAPIYQPPAPAYQPAPGAPTEIGRSLLLQLTSMYG